MNYADFGLGTWQPTNGFYDVVNAMVDLGKSLELNIRRNECRIYYNNNDKKVELD